jgi:Tol biopolymer transport system component
MTALLVLVLAQVPGAIDLDPRLRWYTVETEHFGIHFSLRGRPATNGFAFAREVAGMCEEVHELLTRASGWTPRARTNVIIADFYDYHNGWAAPFPHNTITLIPTAPAGGRTNDDNWLRTLILHEYSHILQTDMVAGLPAALRRIFGRVVMPNALTPAWLNEGYAVYNETRFTAFGRLRGAEYRAMLRAARDAARLLPVDRCGNYELRQWPGGTAPYLYGSNLHGYGAAADSSSWDDYNRLRSASLPFTEDAVARRTFGTGITTIWREAAAALPTSAIADTPLLRPVTQSGFVTGRPRWSASGRELYYVEASGREYPAIRALDTLTRRVRTVHRGSVVGGLSVSADGRSIVFAQLDRQENYYELSDIYRLDLVGSGLSRITVLARARDPDLAPDTAQVVYVTGGSGSSELVLLDLGSGVKSVLRETDGLTSFSSPRFSPGGRWIAVAVSRPGGWSDIELIDRRNGWSVAVTHDRANDITPTWSRTGRTLFFISDRSGTHQLYAYELATGTIHQCTESRYGVFEPAVSPDNRQIALAALGPNGTDVVTIPLQAASWWPANPPNETPADDLAATAIERSPVYHYSPLPSLLPQFWLPWVGDARGFGLGAFTLGWDALQLHRYSVTAAWLFDARTPVLQLSYEYRGLWPTIGLAVNADRRTQEATTKAALELRQTGVVDWLDARAAVVRDSQIRSRVSVAWTRSDALRWRFTAAPVQGGQYGIYLDADPLEFGTDMQSFRPLAYCVRYIGAPPARWSLRAHLAAATGFGSSRTSAWRIADQGVTGVRGYSSKPAADRSLVTAGLQFRVPVAWVERGLGAAPVFLSNVNAAVFADAGIHSPHVIPEPAALSAARLSVGGEVRADLVVLHLVPVSVTAGLGVGLRPSADWRGYATVESSVISELLMSGSGPVPRLP